MYGIILIYRLKFYLNLYFFLFLTQPHLIEVGLLLMVRTGVV